jgi:hypothetical protein
MGGPNDRNGSWLEEIFYIRFIRPHLSLLNNLPFLTALQKSTRILLFNTLDTFSVDF